MVVVELDDEEVEEEEDVEEEDEVDVDDEVEVEEEVEEEDDVEEVYSRSFSQTYIWRESQGWSNHCPAPAWFACWKLTHSCFILLLFGCPMAQL